MRKRFLLALFTLLLSSQLCTPRICLAQKNQSSPANDYNKAMQDKDWPHAVEAAQKLVKAEPTGANIHLLAIAQKNAEQIPEALASYDLAIKTITNEPLDKSQTEAGKKDEIAKMYTIKGDLLLKLQRTDEAIAAYNSAAELSSKPGVANYNICSLLYNAGNTKEAVDFCRKATVADPALAEAWYILATLLVADASSDENGKLLISDETRKAFNKYLEIAPTGPHAGAVKQILALSAPAQ
jgi:tetratricopeptide (TPR) repeat protein